MNIQKNLQEAMFLFQKRDYPGAEKILRKVLRRHPGHTETLSNLAIVCINLNEIDTALKLLKKSLSISYDEKTFKNYLQILAQTKKWQDLIETVQLFNKDNEWVSLQLAIAYRELGDFKKSIDKYEEIIHSSPQNVETYISYGFTLNLNEQYDEAINVYEKGLIKHPENFILNYNLGVVYANINKSKEAVRQLEKASTFNSGNFNLWITLAAQYAQLRDVEAAMKALKKCEEIDSKNSLIEFQEATINMNLGKLDIAENILKNILKKEPENIETNYHLGLIKLMRHDYENLMPYYRYRTKRVNKFGEFDDFNLPLLKQSDNILISWEQGIGDQFLYLRLIPEFIKIYKSVTYLATDKTYDALSEMYPQIKIISVTEYKKNESQFTNFQKINLATMINYIPDLNEKLSQKKHLDFNKILFKNRRIGISWRSENKKIGSEKSVNLEQFSELFENSYKFISLQYGDVNDEINQFNINKRNKLQVLPNLDYFNDIKGLLNLISDCDLVITVSNVTVHLACSLGIPTILLCPKSHGKLWYWYGDNNQSKFYPSLMIVKQENDNCWDNEIKKINSFLKTKKFS